MSRAYLYYCGGTKPLLEMFVSLYSLRKVYSGDIVVVLGETSVPYCKPLLENKIGIEVKIVPDSKNDTRTVHHWATRWRGMKLCQHDQVLHLDCDTIFWEPVDHLFEKIHPDVETVTSYYMWNNNMYYDKWPEHLAAFRKIHPDLPSDTPPLYFGFGLVGWNKGYPWFDEVASYMKYLATDETAMNLVLIKHGRKAHMADITEWDFRLARAYYRLAPDKYYGTKIWHLPGKGPTGFKKWWDQLFLARDEGFFNLNDDEYLKSIHGRAYKLMKTNTWPSSTYKDHRMKENLPYE